ncbi:MAG: hypothetical protein KDB03_01255 [Planctomycetales bacterium]|nr:hypothetical protein [Planctomycetales bacterium]
MQLASFRRHMFVALLLGFLLSNQAEAVPPDWEVLRVYYPADQANRLINRNYLPIELEDLEQSLKREFDRRQTDVTDSPSLTRAIYVASIEGDKLVSDLSCWTIEGSNLTRTYDAGKVSFAIHNARDIPADSEQLLQNLKYSSQGSLEITDTGEVVDRWFGFSQSAEASRPEELMFNLEVPPAKVADLYLLTPAHAVLESSFCVIESGPQVIDSLPELWRKFEPIAGRQIENEQMKWWRIRMSGVAHCPIVYKYKRWNSLNFPWLVDKADLKYTLSPEGIEVTADFAISKPAQRDFLEMDIDSPLRILDVEVNRTTSLWHILPEQSLEGKYRIQIQILADVDRESNAVTPLDITVHCMAPMQQDFEGPTQIVLPGISIRGGYVTRGHTRTAGSSGLLLQEFRVKEWTSRYSGVRTADEISLLEGTLSNVEKDLASAVSSTTQDFWDADWFGKLPPSTCQVVESPTRLHAETLTKLSVQPMSISASTRLRLVGSSLQSNRMRILINAGWFLEQSDLLSSSADGVTLQIIESAPGSEHQSEILLQWDGQQQQIDAELDLLAHRVQVNSDNSSPLDLMAPRPITFFGGTQEDFYTVEPSSNYEVLVTSELINQQRLVSDLPSWQLPLLPNQANRWYFQGTGSSLPPVKLVASAGTFSTQLFAVLRSQPDNKQLEIEYSILCEPRSGALDSLAFQIVGLVDPGQLEWRLDDAVQLRVDPNATRALNAASKNSHIVNLMFPAPLVQRFRITCRMLIQLEEAEARFSLPSVVPIQTSNSELVLATPKNLDLVQGSEIVEIIEAESAEKALNESNLAWESGGYILHLRPDHLPQLTFERSSSPQKNSGWAWGENLQHWIFTDGTQLHTGRWEIEGSSPSTQFIIPPGWQLQSVKLDGRESDYEIEGDGQLAITTPDLHRHVLELVLKSHSAPVQIISSLEVHSPQIALPVLHRSEDIRLPPSHVPWIPLLKSGVSYRLIDRLLPSRCWKLIAPDPVVEMEQMQTGRNQMESNEYLHSQVKNSADNSIHAAITVWVIARTFVSCVAIGLVVLVGVICWWIGDSSPYRWCLLHFSIAAWTVLAPASNVPMLQLALLGVGLATLIKLVCLVLQSHHSRNDKSRQGSTVAGWLKSNGVTSVAVLICSFVLSSPAWAVPQVESTTTEVSDRIFGVLIPLDDEGQVDGDYVYIPSQLRQLLNDTPNNSLSDRSPKILNVDYTLRSRQTTIDLSAEFRLQVSVPQSEIRLSFLSDELRLSQGFVNGQEIFVGNRLRQESEAVVFQSLEAGIVRLRLDFNVLRTNLSFDENSFSVRIPRVASAQIRLVGFANDPKVNSHSALQRNVSGDLQAELGPRDILQASWRSNSIGAISASNYSVISNAWVHVAGNQVVSQTQLDIRRANTLPDVLHLFIENGWEPIGTQLGDATIIETEQIPVGNRRMYAIKKPHDQSDVSISVLLTPIEGTSLVGLSIPFLGLLETSTLTQNRFLTLSSDVHALWKVTGIDRWLPALANEHISWRRGELGDNSTTLRVPSGSITTRLQPLVPVRPFAAESCEMHIYSNELRIKYVTDLFSDVPGQPLSLQIPKACSLTNVTVNGHTAVYSIIERSEVRIAEIGQNEITPRQQIRVELNVPILDVQSLKLPRVILRGYRIEDSVLSVYAHHAVDVIAEVAGDSEFQAGISEINQRHRLESLEYLVGQWQQIDNALGTTPEFPMFYPIDFSMRESKLDLAGTAITTMDRDSQGWLGSYSLSTENMGGAINYLFFEIPSSLRDNLVLNSRTRILPLGDSEKSLLCVAIESSDALQLDMHFRLPAVVYSAQTISPPFIRPISDISVQNFISFPRMLDSQEIEWSYAATQVDASQLGESASRTSEDRTVYRFSDRHTLASWSQQSQKTTPITIQFAHINLKQQNEDAGITGEVRLWLEPKGNTSLEFQLPRNCAFVGAEIDSLPVAAHFDTKSEKYRILLRPNYLPLNFRLLLNWPLDSKAETFGIRLPQFPDVNTVENLTIAIQSDKWHLDGSMMSGSTISQAAVRKWCEILSKTFPILQSRSETELSAWFAAWHPDHVGLDSNAAIGEINSLSWLDESAAPPQTVTECWNSLANQIGIMAEDSAGEDSTRIGQLLVSNEIEVLPTSVSLQVESLINLRETKRVVYKWHQYTAAGLLLIAMVLAFNVADAWGAWALNFFQQHFWAYWLFLSLAMWLVLPVTWPGLGVLVLGGWILISQWNERRIRAKHLLRGA